MGCIRYQADSLAGLEDARRYTAFEELDHKCTEPQRIPPNSSSNIQNEALHHRNLSLPFAIIIILDFPCI